MQFIVFTLLYTICYILDCNYILFLLDHLSSRIWCHLFWSLLSSHQLQGLYKFLFPISRLFVTFFDWISFHSINMIFPFFFFLFLFYQIYLQFLRYLINFIPVDCKHDLSSFFLSFTLSFFLSFFLPFFLEMETYLRVSKANSILKFYLIF